MREFIVSSIARARAELLAFLAEVSGSSWDAPTICPGWSVKDVLAHAVEGELNVGRIYRGEIRELGYVDAETAIANWRQIPGEAVRATLWQHGTASQRALDALGNEGWRRPIHAFGCETISQLARLHLFELAVHGHDITAALDAPPLWGPCLPFLVEAVVRSAPRALARHGVTPAGALVVRVEDTRCVVDGRGGQWVVSEEGPGDATLALDAEALVLLTTGRGFDVAPEAIEGDRDVARRILDGWRVT